MPRYDGTYPRRPGRTLTHGLTRSLTRSLTRPLYGLDEAVRSIKWLLTNVLNLNATVGLNAVAGGTSATFARVWDASVGLLIQEVAAGNAVAEGERLATTVAGGADLGGFDYWNDNLGRLNVGAGWVDNGNGSYTATSTSSPVFIATAGAELLLGELFEFDVVVSGVTGGTIRGEVGSSDTVQLPSTGKYYVSVTSEVQNRPLLRPSSFTGTIKINSVKQVLPTFKNTVASDDDTKLHPTKILTENGVTSTVFLLYDYWPGAAQGVSAGAKIYVIGTDGHNYSLSTVSGGTTDSAIPTVDTSDIGGTVADNDITWDVDHYYSNLATATKNYLPRVLSEVEAINRGLYARDFTQAEWVKTTMTAAKDQTGFDGSANGASSLLATAGNATALQTYTVASAEFVSSCDVKRLTGTGTVEFTVDGGTTWTDITTNLSTSQWFRAEATKTAANPEYGFRIVTDTDKIAVDFGGVELGSVASSRMPTTNSTVTRDATEFLVTPDTAAFLRIRFADVNPQTFLLSGTVKVSYDGTDVTVTDGTNAMTYTVAMEVGDWITIEEATGKLYYRENLVDTNGSYSPSWGEIATGNAVDYQFGNDIDPTDVTWSQP